MTPLSTSPVPAVASRADPAAASTTRPSGPATTVVDPLSRTTAPLRRDAIRQIEREKGGELRRGWWIL